MALDQAVSTTLNHEDQLRRARVEFAKELDRYSIRVLLYVRGTGERPTKDDEISFYGAFDRYGLMLKHAVEEWGDDHD